MMQHDIDFVPWPSRDIANGRLLGKEVFLDVVVDVQTLETAQIPRIDGDLAVAQGVGLDVDPAGPQRLQRHCPDQARRVQVGAADKGAARRQTQQRHGGARRQRRERRGGGLGGLGRRQLGRRQVGRGRLGAQVARGPVGEVQPQRQLRGGGEERQAGRHLRAGVEEKLHFRFILEAACAAVRATRGRLPAAARASTAARPHAWLRVHLALLPQTCLARQTPALPHTPFRFGFGKCRRKTRLTHCALSGSFADRFMAVSSFVVKYTRRTNRPDPS
ncbi:hypothetical protein BDR26DRAFT_158939 [Obelidium mucronatum]|nr:hypothetical protein BDR26DRAFT_158939 [Obelidium mucronatum]